MMDEDRYVSARLRGFTPLMDVLVMEYDVITAAVWGRIWRYAQGENGVCSATIERIAEDLRLNRRTIIRKIKDLIANEYLLDLTPNTRYKPHTYAITQKAAIMVTIEGVTLSHTQVTLSHTVCDSKSPRDDTESLKDTSKKQLKKQVKKDSQQMQESSRIISLDKEYKLAVGLVEEIEAIKEEQNKPIDTTPDAIKAIQEVAIKYPGNRIIGERRPADQVIVNGAALDYNFKQEYEQTFHVFVKWEGKDGRSFLKWLKERPLDQTVGLFASWWKTQDWRGKQGQPPSISQVMELWPQAFLNGANRQSRAAEVF